MLQVFFGCDHESSGNKLFFGVQKLVFESKQPIVCSTYKSCLHVLIIIIIILIILLILIRTIIITT